MTCLFTDLTVASKKFDLALRIRKLYVRMLKKYGSRGIRTIVARKAWLEVVNLMTNTELTTCAAQWNRGEN